MERMSLLPSSYGQNSPENMCHTTQMVPLIIVTFWGLTLTLTFARLIPITHSLPSPYLLAVLWPSLGQDKLNAASPGPQTWKHCILTLQSQSESECVLKPPSDGYSGLEDYSLLYVRLPKR